MKTLKGLFTKLSNSSHVRSLKDLCLGRNLGITVGFLITALYSALVLLYRGEDVWKLRNLPLSELGDFLTGVFGPLAFLWLVLGYFQQRRELNENTAELRKQAEASANTLTWMRNDLNQRMNPDFRLVHQRTWVDDPLHLYRSVFLIENRGEGATEFKIEPSARYEMKIKSLEPNSSAFPRGDQRTLEFEMKGIEQKRSGRFDIHCLNVFGHPHTQKIWLDYDFENKEFSAVEGGSNDGHCD